jgi:hypothetical protein
MSLFIGELAFADPGLIDSAKLGILAGSAVSVLAAFLVLEATRTAGGADPDRAEADELFGETFHEEGAPRDPPRMR